MKVVHQIRLGVGVVREWMVPSDEVAALLASQPTFDPRYVFWVSDAA